MDLVIIAILLPLLVWLSLKPAKILKRKGYDVSPFLSIVIFIATLGTGVLYGFVFAWLIPFNNNNKACNKCNRLMPKMAVVCKHCGKSQIDKEEE